MKYIIIIICLFVFLSIPVQAGTGVTGIREYYNPSVSASTQRWLYVLNGTNNITDLASTPLYNLTYNSSVEYANSQIGFTLATGLDRIAQSFIAPYSHNVDAISIPVGSYMTQDQYNQKTNMTLFLYSNATGGYPDQILRTSILHYNEFVRDGASYYSAMMTFPLNESYALVGGTSYWIVMNVSVYTAVSTTNVYSIQIGTTAALAPYASGWTAVSTNGGTTWTHYNGTTNYDIPFWIWSKTGTLSSGITNVSGAVWTNTTAVKIVGDAVLKMNSGDRFNINNTIADAGYYNGICVGHATGGYGSGGTFIVNATPSVPAIINSTNARSGWAVATLGGSAYINGLNVYGSYYSSSIRPYSAYGSFELTNSKIENTYNAATGYSMYVYTGYRRMYFNNDTFYRNSATASYNIISAAGASPGIVMIGCNLTSTTAYATPFYNANYATPYNTLINNSYKSGALAVVPLNSTNIINVYRSSGFILGHSVTPKIVDSNGNPVEGAIVTLIPQFDDRKDAPFWGYGETDESGDYTGVYPTFLYNQVLEKPQIYSTNADGYALDENNNSQLYVKQELHFDTTEQRVLYFTGSNTGYRPQQGYTWKNDGTDYGYVLTVTKSGYSGFMQVIPANQSYTNTITLTTSLINSSITGTINQTNSFEYFSNNYVGHNGNCTDSDGVYNMTFESNYTGTLRNYTPYNTSLVTYHYNFTDSTPRYYSYKWYCRDLLGHENDTDIEYFSIIKNQSNPINVSFNGLWNVHNTTYVEYLNVTPILLLDISNINITGNISLFESGINVSSNISRNLSYSPGTYYFYGYTDGNENYTSNTTGIFTVIIISVADTSGGNPQGGGPGGYTLTGTNVIINEVDKIKEVIPTWVWGFMIGAVSLIFRRKKITILCTIGLLIVAFLYMDWIPIVIIAILWILSKKLKQRDKEKRI